MNLIERARLAWRVMTYKPGNLMSHAERELGAGLDVELKELLLVFSSQGHSGGSASVTAPILDKLLRYEPIGPLTGEDGEWFVHDHDDECYAQNIRCSHVFKRRDGSAYDIDGIVWRDPDGSTFTNRDSRTPVTFPYTPTTEYRPRPAAQ